MGEIVRVRGLRGEVVIRSYTEDPRMVAGYGPVTDDSGRTYALKIEGTDGEMVRARIDGVEDRNGAEALRGVRLYVPRAALPAPAPGEVYRADLVGLKAVGDDGADWGRVRAVEDYGGGPFLELDKDGPDGPVCVPFTAETCAVDLGEGVVRITMPDGLLEPAPRADAEAEPPAAHPRRRRGNWRRRRRG